LAKEKYHSWRHRNRCICVCRESAQISWLAKFICEARGRKETGDGIPHENTSFTEFLTKIGYLHTR